jgi:hypothetical protein
MILSCLGASLRSLSCSENVDVNDAMYGEKHFEFRKDYKIQNADGLYPLFLLLVSGKS